MNANPYLTVREAMRLVRSGELLAATAAIQRRLKGGIETESALATSDPGQRPIDASFRVVDEETSSAAEKAPDDGSPSRPSASAERTQFSAHTYTGSAGTRRYKLFIPNAYRGQPMPLVVMLHGCTQTPDDFATGTRMNKLAEERGCFVVYPAQPQTANMSKCWNWFKAGDQRRDQGEPAIIAGLARELLQTYGLDHGRVYVGGLSAGGAMAVILGRTHPDLFAAVGVHSGLPYAAAHDLPSALAAMHHSDPSPGGATRGDDRQAARDAIPTIVFHGDSDTTVHPSNGEKVVRGAGANVVNGADGSPPTGTTEESCAGRTPGGHSYTRSSFKDAEGNVVVEYWLVHGAAHAWFGGDPRGSYTDARGPDASGEMMRFFLERERKSV